MKDWQPGDRAIFTYSLPRDPHSSIYARLGERSGRAVTVLGRGEDDGDLGEPKVYSIRFADGHTDTAFEDELKEDN